MNGEASSKNSMATPKKTSRESLKTQELGCKPSPCRKCMQIVRIPARKLDNDFAFGEKIENLEFDARLRAMTKKTGNIR